VWSCVKVEPYVWHCCLFHHQDCIDGDCSRLTMIPMRLKTLVSFRYDVRPVERYVTNQSAASSVRYDAMFSILLAPSQLKMLAVMMYFDTNSSTAVPSH
jgi:hypothetical protein